MASFLLHDYFIFLGIEMLHQKKIRAIVFDLDGTLVNTVKDIGDSLNEELDSRNLPTFSYDDYKKLIGGGTFNLVKKIIPDYAYDDLVGIHDCFVKRYEDNLLNKTKPYYGVIKMLERLKNQGYFLGILSNKDDPMVNLIVNYFFKNIPFNYVCGSKVGVKKKPDPSCVYELCAVGGFTPQEIVYVGDTEIDMQTAINSGMYPLGVSWGFRSSQELMASGAKSIINNPFDLVLELEKNTVTLPDMVV
jgi:phosphoglycolate phosphatase